MKSELIAFQNRSARSEYVARRFLPYLGGRILDVGCDKAVLRRLLPKADYTGVDLGGEPDLKLNLEQIEGLPFDDGSFDCVVCTDVLEHLENLHHMFGELVRVSRRHVVLSLPNNWTNARGPIEKGHGSFGKYGLPAAKPPDRHKWFFSLSEAADFLHAQAERHPVRVIEMHATEKQRPAVIRASRRVCYPSAERYLNRYAHTLKDVLENR
jgi:SAM-dependent methyltransferase